MSSMASNSEAMINSNDLDSNPLQNPSSTTLKPSIQEYPSSILRLWRPNAQRNLRNQWSKLSSLRHQWLSISSSARNHATSLVNSYLSIRYMDDMDLGVLKDLPNIKKKACQKLLKQQDLQRNQLISSYKSMVGVVCDMTNSSRSMRSFLKRSSGSPLVEFTNKAEDSDDIGDGGGALVTTFFSILAFESFAEEVVEMFKQELLLKRLLVVELLSLTSQKYEQDTRLCWADGLYQTEADDLSICNLYSEATTEPCLPKLHGCISQSACAESDKHPSEEVLRVYLTTWLSEVNIDTYRVEEIFSTVGEEMRTSFS